jgi:hypothetical protein
MEIDALQRVAGRFCELELVDGFRAYVWINVVDPTFLGQEVNVDVITVHALGTRTEDTVPYDTPLTIAAGAILRAVPEDAA